MAGETAEIARAVERGGRRNVERVTGDIQ